LIIALTAIRSLAALAKMGVARYDYTYQMRPDTSALGTEGFTQARQITARYARTFFFASHFLPAQARRAAYVVYAVCRLSDDAVDQDQPVPGWQNLRQMEANIAAAYAETPLADPLLRAFRQTVRQYHIPRDYFELLQEGLRWDTEKKRYADFTELYAYCYRVAGVVGLMMAHLLVGTPTEPIKQHAVELGIAMQLTNILRDIREDYGRGRIYLPQDEMHGFGVTEQMIAAGRPEPGLQDLLAFQIQRARDYYHQAGTGISLLPSYRCRLVTALMSELYAKILAAIERNRYDLTIRAATTTREKIKTALHLLWTRPVL